MRRVAIVLALCFVAVVKAHSWIDCTNGPKNPQYYNAADCKARPRNWKNHAGGGVFGADTGYNFQGNSEDICLYPLKAGVDVNSFYTAQYPMATYQVGQEVCLTWPSKNHVAASCTNSFIPDTSNKVYMSSANPTADPTGTGWRQIADFGNNPSGTPLESGGGKGFQNCPKFCENMDKSICGQCFTIPAGTTPGVYAFQWRWVFNANTPAYTSCWDANVVAAGPTTSGAPTTATTTTTAAPGAPTTTTTQRPLSGDSVRLATVPTYIQGTATTVDVSVEYSATQTVDIVVDFLSSDYNKWFGKAIQKNVPAGKGTLSMTISVQNSPPIGPKVLKPWIVAAGRAEAAQGWAFELDKKEYTVPYGGPTPTPALTTTAPSESARIVAGITFLVLLVSVLMFAI